MTPLAFFRDPETQRLLQRAALAAGMPLSLHYVANGEESPKIESWGSCAACAHVSALPNGRKACRTSRLQAATDALRQNRPLPFLCHLGFACVSAPVLPGEGYVLTLGPYVPQEAAESLEFDARGGLNALLAEGDEEQGQSISLPAGTPLPFVLDDLHHAPVASVPALAEWLRDELRRAWNEAEPESLNVEASDRSDLSDLSDNVSNPPHPPRRPRKAQPGAQPYAASAIAAAIAGENQPLARELLLGVLAEAEAQPSRRQHVQRGRILAAVGAALEALENTGLDTTLGWEAFSNFTAQARQAESPAQLVDAAMLVLGPLRRHVAKQPQRSMDYTQLNEIVNARLFENITLEEVARILGENPSAISQRLRRKFGMSYSEYAGRLRISKAKELLRRTKLSATEIAQRVGISDQSNFSKLFNKYEGLSPLEYRDKFALRK